MANISASTKFRPILLGTQNSGKLREYERLMEPLERVRIAVAADYGISLSPAETGDTLEENALIKANFYHRLSGIDTLADDSGLEVDALGGEPGVYSARYGNKRDANSRNLYLLQQLSKTVSGRRQARFKTVLVFISDRLNSPLIATGELCGSIAVSPAGSSGFGYDPVFIPKEHTVTMAELSFDSKNALSHRGVAARKMCSLLTEAGL